MNSKPNKAESDHMSMVKSLPCSVCDLPGPSEAHHIKQGDHYTTVSACSSCHRDPVMGIHGQKRMWKIMKIDELGALNITLARLLKMERKV